MKIHSLITFALLMVGAIHAAPFSVPITDSVIYLLFKLVKMPERTLSFSTLVLPTHE